MEDYKSNSDKARQEQQSEKKVEAVITGAAKTRKKGEMQKFADVFIAEDANNVKSYILMEVIVPAVKKAISDIVTTGIDMILYGEAGRSKKNGTASKVSYRNYYDQGTDRVRAGSVGNRRNTPDYDDSIKAFECLTGHISGLCTLSGKLTCFGSLSGKLSAVIDFNAYSGEYEVVPNAFNTQVLPTANKVLKKDIIVQKVPYFETSNNYDGVTVYIAEEVNQNA